MRPVEGEQRSKNALLTLTGFLFWSNEMFSGLPPLNAADLRYAMNESLYVVQTNSGHSPDPKSKSNASPFAFAGTLIWSFKSARSFTVLEMFCVGHDGEAFG